MAARKKKRFTVEPGRQIYCDGTPFISVGREGRTMPADADEATHKITALLNRSRASCTPFRDTLRKK